MPRTLSERCASTRVVRDGREYLFFGGCNYLGLAQHPRVLDATRTALEQFGLSSSASRETTGNTTPHHDLEQRLCAFARADDALLMPDGYTANLAALQGLEATGFTRVVIDERAHRSLTDAARLAGMEIEPYAHADPEHARTLISRHDTPCAVLTDGVFTAHGAIAPVPALLAALRPCDALVLDDCHGLGVLGPGGRGTAHHFGIDRDPKVLVTSTLCKGLGGSGGIILGPAPWIDAARRHASAYICTTPTSPPAAAGTAAALEVLMSDPSMLDQLRNSIERLDGMLDRLGIGSHHDPTPIRAFLLGDDAAMERLERDLADEGVIVPLIRYPGGPSSCYFRIVVNASHTPRDLAELDTILTRCATNARETALRS